MSIRKRLLSHNLIGKTDDEYIDDEIIAERRRREESLRKAELREKRKKRERGIGRDKNRREANKMKVIASMKITASKKRQNLRRQHVGEAAQDTATHRLKTSKGVQQTQGDQGDPFPRRSRVPRKTT